MTPPPHSDARRITPAPHSDARSMTSPPHSDFPAHLRWAALLSALVCAGCGNGHPAAPPPSANAPAAVTAPSRATTPASSAHYDLTRDERRGGHTLARHIGRSDAELRERLRRERSISDASTWPDLSTAETTVARALDAASTRLARWSALTGRRANLALDWSGTKTIGRSLTRGARSPQSVACAVVVLHWDEENGSWFVLTTYPEVCR